MVLEDGVGAAGGWMVVCMTIHRALTCHSPLAVASCQGLPCEADTQDFSWICGSFEILFCMTCTTALGNESKYPS